MEGVFEVRPNMATHPQFGEALEAARAAGVQVLHLPCRVTPDSLEIETDHGDCPRDCYSFSSP